MFSKIREKRPNPERFARAMEGALSILPGASSGLPQIKPTGGLVRRTGKVVLLDKSLDQPHPMAIAVVPIA